MFPLILFFDLTQMNILCKSQGQILLSVVYLLPTCLRAPLPPPIPVWILPCLTWHSYSRGMLVHGAWLHILHTSLPAVSGESERVLQQVLQGLDKQLVEVRVPGLGPLRQLLEERAVSALRVRAVHETWKWGARRDNSAISTRQRRI